MVPLSGDVKGLMLMRYLVIHAIGTGILHAPVVSGKGKKYTENDSKVGLGLSRSPRPTFESFSV